MDKVLIIAEAGVNHNGDLALAKKLIDVAADAGADYVKFQTFKAEKLVAKDAPQAAYQKINLNDAENTQFGMLKKLELKEEWHHELINHSAKKKIKFLSTGFDNESLVFLNSLNIKLAKIPSGEITNLPYLKKIAELFPEVIMSTGMAEMDEIKEAMSVLLRTGVKKENITILHCNTEYPTPMRDVNLNAMLHIKREFGVSVGYSDHTLGIEVPIAAVALGACIIEKHFTLSRTMVGPDHNASLEPDELAQMVRAIRNIEMALGNGIKEPSESEKKNRIVVRKSIVASQEIKKGEFFSESNISVKRSGSFGISAMRWEEVLGQRAKKNFTPDELIEI